MNFKRTIFNKVFRGQSKGYMEHLKNQTIRNKYRIINYNFLHNRTFSPYPLYAKIEINGSCNLDCVMCFRKSLPNRDKWMNKLQFTTILDHIPSLIEWSPHGYNEPLLHPYFFDFVEETNERNISLYLVTNGTALNKVNADKLINLEPREVRISIDAVGETYESIRRGANYNQMCDNIKYLTDNYDKVSLYATIWKDNMNQIPLLKNLADFYNIPISFSDVTWKNEFGQSTQKNSIRESFSEEFILELQTEHQVFLGKPTKRSCTLPWSSLYIDVIGDIFPCTDTLNYKMGNILEKHIKDIYNNDSYKGFRENSLTGFNYECRNCAAWSPEPKKALNKEIINFPLEV